MLPGRRQAIISINADILSIGTLGINFNEIINQYRYIFIHENAFENVVCEVAVILSNFKLISQKNCELKLIFRLQKTNFGKMSWKTSIS